MTNFKCAVEYDGTLFNGWSKQPGQRTIQEEIEKALNNILNSETNITCAGRTDKGVHALGQVINFETEREISPEKLIVRLNSLLPDDIAIKSSAKTSESFSARKSAKYKTYIYRIFNHPVRSPLYRTRAWYISKPLNMEKMKKAASFLKGKRDFSVFDSYNSVFDYKIVDLKDVKVVKKDKFIDMYITGDRFLYKMIRKIAGELVRIGRGEQTFENFKDSIINKNKEQLGKPAPSCGLYLAKIIYK
ncbi:MAG: tRNA pseudouridine(38-40) synthase TruA [Endomicrobia bacterium]|nr:tRNA pseudouridine(38-40) synthase TruA [Bacillota bacterium]MCL1972110.1 tRNA pseudouridine(38-40) synthase TruA [Endomicrobiia bacterium]